MSYSSPAGWADRATIRDDDAPHQIRLDLHKSATGRQDLVVSCTCRPTGIANATGPSYQPLGVIHDTEQAWALWRRYHDEVAVAP